jgi:hypothetical protein
VGILAPHDFPIDPHECGRAVGGREATNAEVRHGGRIPLEEKRPTVFTQDCSMSGVNVNVRMNCKRRIISYSTRRRVGKGMMGGRFFVAEEVRAALAWGEERRERRKLNWSGT